MTNADKNFEQATSIIEMTKGDTTGWYAELYERQDEPVRILLDQIMHELYLEEHGLLAKPPSEQWARQAAGRKGRVHLTMSAEPVDASGQELNQLPRDFEDEIEASKQKIFAKLDGITAENVVAPKGTGKVDPNTLPDAVKPKKDMTDAEMYQFARGFFAGRSPEPTPPESRAIKITIDAGGSTTFLEIPV